MLLRNGQKCIVLMLDGFGTDYFQLSDMPNLKRMAAAGLCKDGKAIFPTLTNANNISIVCGAFPEIHGVTTNCYLDLQTGKPAFLEDPGFLRSPTLFDIAARKGVRSALVTSKAKTIRILGSSVSVGAAVQDPDAAMVRKYGAPPDVYSIEANEWIFRAGMKMLNDDPDLGVLYVHTTDYPMHMWAPTDERSLDHLARLDVLIGQLANEHPEAAFLVTADHGMNSKRECLDLDKILRSEDFPIRAAISPVADRLVKHHGGHGGVSYIYMEDRSATAEVMGYLRELSSVDTVFASDEAAAKYRLAGDRIGDIVVGAAFGSVFGTVEAEVVELGPDYRNHGSRFESDIPLIAYNVAIPPDESIEYNLDLTRAVFFADRQ